MRGDRRSWVVAAVVALALAGSASANAGAVTFGADLNNAPNNTATCGDGVFPYYSAPMGSPSCLYFSGAPGPSPYAPESGTVTAVHVRVGNVTGPMQVVIMRSLYQNNVVEPGRPDFACCFVERYGPTFTPEANTIATVRTDLPMTEEPTPPPDDFSTSAADDFLALSVLAPNVPIPAFLDQQSGYSGYYPAPTEGTFPAPSLTPLFAATDGTGAQVMLSADLEGGGTGGGGGAPGGGGGGGAPGGGGTPRGAGAPGQGGPAPKAGPVPVPVIGLPDLTIPLEGNAMTVPLRCLVVDCTGTLTLQNVQLAGQAELAARKKKTPGKPAVVSYGSAGFSIKAGTTGKVNVTLNGNGRKLFKRGRKSARVWATVRFSSGGGTPKSVPVKLIK